MIAQGWVNAAGGQTHAKKEKKRSAKVKRGGGEGDQSQTKVLTVDTSFIQNFQTIQSLVVIC